MDSRGMADLHVRLPGDLARLLADLAARERRSLTNMAEVLIREALERRQAERRPPERRGGD